MKRVSALILAAIMILSLSACGKADNTSSDIDTNSSENISSADESSETGTSSNEVNSTSSTGANSSEASNKKENTSNTVNSNNKNNVTSKNQSSSKPVVVQSANPETGISWDGKSPIIYTYPDGTTGTEKRVGATYEVEPGLIYTIREEKGSAENDHLCSDCGKVIGNGTNGTCNQWLMGDVNCPNCGEYVKVRTCHTCK